MFCFLDFFFSLTILFFLSYCLPKCNWVSDSFLFAAASALFALGAWLAGGRFVHSGTVALQWLEQQIFGSLCVQCPFPRSMATLECPRHTRGAQWGMHRATLVPPCGQLQQARVFQKHWKSCLGLVFPCIFNKCAVKPKSCRCSHIGLTCAPTWSPRLGLSVSSCHVLCLSSSSPLPSSPAAWCWLANQCFEPKLGIQESCSQISLKCFLVFLCPLWQLYNLIINGSENLRLSAAGPLRLVLVFVLVSPKQLQLAQECFC